MHSPALEGWPAERDGRRLISWLDAAAMRKLDDIAEEYDFLEGDERYRLLIELGRDLETMRSEEHTSELQSRI